MQESSRHMADIALTANSGAAVGMTLFNIPIHDIYSMLGIGILLIQFIYWIATRKK